MTTIIKHIILVVITLGIIPSLSSQTVEEIIDLHIKAHGGLEKWDKVESMKITGKFTAFSLDDDFLAIKTKDGSYYSELSLGDKRVIEAFNGESGWTIDPWHEILFPRKLNKNEINAFLQKSEFISPFFNYKERGIVPELLGKDNFEGTEVWKIKITRPNGKWETWFLDANTYLEVKSNSYWVDFGYPAPAATFFDDFRDFDGLIIPCFVERTFYQRDRMLFIDDIVFNDEIDEDIFCMPKSEQMEKLSFMEGEWDVAVNAWSRRANRWYNVDSTESEIEFESNNLLIEEIRYSNVYVQEKVINYSYSAENEEYLISAYDGFSSEMHIFTGEMTDTAFIVTNKIDICDSTSVPAIKCYYKKISDNEMELTITNSYDSGATWNESEKLIYTRKD